MIKADKKREIFERMNVTKSLLYMATPTVIGQLVMFFYSIADTFYIGKTDNPYMIGAVSIVVVLYMLISSVSNLFSIGGGSMMVRLMGKGDIDEARKTSSYSICFAVLTSFCFSMLCLLFMDPLLNILGANENSMEYARHYLIFTVILGGIPTVLSLTLPALLRDAGYAKESGAGVIMCGLLNVALDPLCMFVLLPDGYQVLGAALATMIANILAMTYYLIVIHKIKGESVLVIPHNLVKLRPTTLRAIYFVGAPACLQWIMSAATSATLNRLAVSHSDEALAAVGILQTAERLPQNIGIGIGLSMIPLVAYNYANNDEKRTDRFFSVTRMMILITVSLISILFFIFAEPIMRLYIQDTEILGLGVQFMQGRCFSLIFMMLTFQMINFSQAVNRGGTTLLMSAIRNLALCIPIMIIFDQVFGLTGLIWSQLAADVINFAITYLLHRRIRRSLFVRPAINSNK